MRTFLMTAVVLGAFALMPGAQAAAHQAAWHSAGYALDAANNLYHIDVRWHGTCTSVFSIVVTDMDGVEVSRRDFRGSQTLADLSTGPYSEGFNMVARSSTPGITMNLAGVQWFHIAFFNAGYMWQHLTGSYMEYPTVYVNTLNEPWTFCN